MFIHKKRKFIRENENRYMRRRFPGRISEARLFRPGLRKFRKLHETVENDIPEEPIGDTETITISLSKEELDILKSILDKAGCCDDEAEEDEQEEIEDVEIPTEGDVEDIDVSPEEESSAYFG